uniref:Ig-like domain-containing protein n=1 Tax=Oreochromis aureus TaxID=47969 RepID=A0A668SC25_OREAU
RGILKTVHVGETATFTCDLSNEELSSRKVQWYKQRVGDTLQLIVSLYGKPSSEFPQSRFSAHNSKDFSNLTIWNVVQEDEGMYHCVIDNWIKLEWSGTYLLVKGNTERTSNYIVVQQPIESNPLRPGDTATLQCSVLTNSEKNRCSGHHNVFWFRDGSKKSLPNIIYTDGNRTDQCEKRTDVQDGCVYRFSKKVSSSDAGTYYCAVATCGEILFGNGTKLHIQGICIIFIFKNHREAADLHSCQRFWAGLDLLTVAGYETIYSMGVFHLIDNTCSYVEILL